MYKVVGTVKSRALRVMWMLEELGQTYEVIPAAARSDDAFVYNSLGKIPALVDGDAVLTDSVAIMTYLADKHGAMIAQAGTIERAKQDALTLWVIDEMDAVLWTFTKHNFLVPEEHRLTNLAPGLHHEFEKTMAQFDDMLEAPFLMGDQISLPDILACHCLSWAFGVGFPPAGEKTKTYLKSCRARPAFRAAVAHAA